MADTEPRLAKRARIELGIVVLSVATLILTLPIRRPDFSADAWLAIGVGVVLLTIWFLLPNRPWVDLARLLAAAFGLLAALGAIAEMTIGAAPTLEPMLAVVVAVGGITERVALLASLPVMLGLGLAGYPLLGIAGQAIGDTGFLAIALLGLLTTAASIALVWRAGGRSVKVKIAALLTLVFQACAVLAFATFLLGDDHWGPIAFQPDINAMAVSLSILSMVFALLWVVSGVNARRSVAAGAADSS